tara:strand:+ start:1407 stop:1763 length:357 start_codon:yes stop_codon:yes gene_type:complete
MDKTKEVAIDINLSDWSIKLKERTRSRMKLQIKLNQIEAQAFKNFAEVVKPDEISDEDFLKSIFKMGLETMESKLMSAVEKHAEENNIDLESLRDEAGYDSIEELVAESAKADGTDEN